MLRQVANTTGASSSLDFTYSEKVSLADHEDNDPLPYWNLLKASFFSRWKFGQMNMAVRACRSLEVNRV